MIRLSPEAEADLRDIIGWISRENSPAIALRVHDRIVAGLSHLDRFPHMARTGRVLETRELVITGLPYLAVCRIEVEGVLILRILHGSMQWPPADGS